MSRNRQVLIGNVVQTHNCKYGKLKVKNVLVNKTFAFFICKLQLSYSSYAEFVVLMVLKIISVFIRQGAVLSLTGAQCPASEL